MVRLDDKRRAIALRAQGYSYREIMSSVKVAKSTLSIWLRDVGLTDAQVQRLTQKKIDAIERGHVLWRQKRISKTKNIISLEENKVGDLSIHDLWLIGTALYWAEGTKAKEYNVSQRVIFSNSDPRMIVVFLEWLKKCLSIPDESIILELYIHDSHILEKDNIIEYWSDATGFSRTKFDRIYLKTHVLSSFRHKNDYHGLLRVVVRRSTDLNRMIEGWVCGIYKQCRVV